MNNKMIATNQTVVTKPRRNLLAETQAEASPIKLAVSTTDSRPLYIVTDAWAPQLNGVAFNMKNLQNALLTAGYNVRVLNPQEFKTMGSIDPTISVATLGSANIMKVLDIFDKEPPQSVFIATEGPPGIMARQLCKINGWPYTTHYASKFPEFLDNRYRHALEVMHKLIGTPDDLLLKSTYGFLRWFHQDSNALILRTESVEKELVALGFNDKVNIWGAGVDSDRFNPEKKVPGFMPKSINPLWKGGDLPRPWIMTMGRVELEKDYDALAKLDLQKDLGLPAGMGTKIIIGGGTDLERLMREYPDVLFTGPITGDNLAIHLANADAFVFTSKTDTFGMVMIEAGAAGAGVAAFNVTGPKDVYAYPGGEKAGVLGDDLAKSIQLALKLNPEQCREFVLANFTIKQVAERFATFQYGIPQSTEPTPASVMLERFRLPGRLLSGFHI